jgi:3-dehydroquinate synthase
MGLAEYNEGVLTNLQSTSPPYPTLIKWGMKKAGIKRGYDFTVVKDIKMIKVDVNLGEKSYPIFIGTDILGKVGEFLNNYELSRKIAVISNPVVWKLYGAGVIKSLKSSGFSPVKIIIPDGEKYKNLKTVEKIYTEMLKAGIDRKGSVVALGGGVIGDIAGFVSATYMRGIKFVQVPTTLLAQVDASIGGKTGVDHKLGKNLIGAFHQPLFVLSDVSLLKTLPEREYRAGLAEVIKYGVIKDAQLFEFMEKEKERVLARDHEALFYIVKRCSEIKAEIVEKDEREETGLRSILNFGHTVGHAIEAATGYRKFLHGEAVAMGMVVETALSDYLTGKKFSSQISNLINSYHNIKFSYVDRGILSFIRYDKKLYGDKVKFFKVESIGNIAIDTINIRDLKAIISKLKILNIQWR